MPGKFQRVQEVRCAGASDAGAGWEREGQKEIRLFQVQGRVMSWGDGG